jgi:hypothetical protein
MSKVNPSELIKRAHEIDDHSDVQNKRFAEFLKPFKEEREKIANELLAYLNENGGEAFKCEHGTAYLSEKMQTKIDPNAPAYKNASGEDVAGRDAVLDFALEHWEEIGGEMLDIRTYIGPVRKWMDTHNGTPPPGISITYHTSLNIRRS